MDMFFSVVFFIFLGGFLLTLLLPWIVRLWLRRVQKRFQKSVENQFGYEARTGGQSQAGRGMRGETAWGAQDSVHGAQKSAWGAQNSVHGAQNSAWGAQNSAWGAQNSVHGAQKKKRIEKSEGNYVEYEEIV